MAGAEAEERRAEAGAVRDARPRRRAVLPTARRALPTTTPSVFSSGAEKVTCPPSGCTSPRGTSSTTVVPEPGRGEEPGVAADVAQPGDDRFGEAELGLVDVADVESDSGVGHHRADHLAVLGDRDVGLGDAGVAPHVLEALGEGEQEGVEDVARAAAPGRCRAS